jgi:hypothetical protein
MNVPMERYFSKPLDAWAENVRDESEPRVVVDAGSGASRAVTGRTRFALDHNSITRGKSRVGRASQI